MLLGSDNGGTVTPTDGSVTGDKIASNAAITTTGAANFNGGITMGGTTPTLTIGDAGAEDTKIVFDGNAQDFYIGLDDSADDLIIGKGSSVGTTPAISIDENTAVTIGAANTASSIAGVTFYVGQSGSIYTTDVSGTDNDAENNTAFGTAAMDAITTGDNNVAMGEHALGALNTGADNVAIGYNAGSSATDGSYSVMIGRNAGAANNNRLTAVGYYAGAASTAIANTFVGFNTGSATTSGGYNTAVGYNAYYQPDTEQYNTAVGYAALGGVIAGGEYNVGVGYDAFYTLTSGDGNIGMGRAAGGGVTTGSFNCYLGHRAGQYTTVSTTGDANTVIGAYAKLSAVDGTEQIVIGYNHAGNGNNTAKLGGANVYHGGNTTTWSTTSDRRIKKNIDDNNVGLDIINQIRVRNFEYRTKDEITDFDNLDDLASVAVDKTGTQLGVIAQEIKEVLPDVVKKESTGAYASSNVLTSKLASVVSVDAVAV